MATSNTHSIHLQFAKPEHGHWDHGPRNGGIFTIDAIDHQWMHSTDHPGPGHIITWGSWNLNMRITTRSGVSWKHAATIAAKRLRRLCLRDCTVSVEVNTDGNV